MNILTDTLPNELIICGKSCPIKNDFRTWIRVAGLINNMAFNDISVLNEILKLVFFELPPRLVDAIAAILEFYNPKKGEGNCKAVGERKKVYDFYYDAELIYAAFWGQYNIDLSTRELHWWQFKTLFDNLSEETQFIKVVGYRSVNLETIKDKEQKKFYRRMKRIYKLPDNRTEEQKEQDMVDTLTGCFFG